MRHYVTFAVAFAFILVAGFRQAIATPPQKTNGDRALATLPIIRNLGMALEGYANEHQAYPAVRDVDELIALLTPTYGKDLSAIDGWGHQLIYLVPPKLDQYKIISAGSDGHFRENVGTYVAPPADHYITPHISDDFTDDIVFANGAFVCYPSIFATWKP